MEVTVRTASDPVIADDGLPAYREFSQGPVLDLSVTIPEKCAYTSFDIAQIRLQGAIKTRIGSRISVQKVLNRVEYAPWSQFLPAYAASTATKTTYTAQVSFDRSGKASRRSTVLPSTTFTGSTYVTQHTALNDRHLVQGTCDTHCWVSVDLIKDGVSVHQSQQSVRLDGTPRHLSLTSPKQAGQPAKTICRPSRTAFWSSAPQTTAEVSLPQDTLHLTTGKLATGESYTSAEIPLEATFSHTTPQLRDAMAQSSGIRCTVESKWYTKRTFAASSTVTTAGLVGSVRDKMEISKELVSSQESEVVFPPLLSNNSSHEEGTTASTLAMLQLILPSSASFSSIETEVLSVRYEVELRYTFHLGAAKQAVLLKGRSRVGCGLSL